jgi:predicted transcriptional regulator
MESTIQQLIAGRPQPITVRPDNTVQEALEVMIKNDFSQLPVVDNKNKVVASKEKKAYLITSDSILRALSTFGIPLHTENLLVSDAMTLTSTFGVDEEIFDLFEALKDNQAVLVINDEKHTLVDIITSFDSTVFFRQRAWNNILIEWIESTLKDYITLYFKGNIGEAYQVELQSAIEAIMPSLNKLRDPFFQALTHYETTTGSNSPINEQAAQEAFTQYLHQERTPTFDDLSLSHYIDLFTNKSRWDSYKVAFKLKREVIYRLLDDVRKTRNKLMHFRDEISMKERNQLQYCKEWLELHRKEVEAIFPLKAIEAESEQKISIVQVEVPGTMSLTTVEEFVNQQTVSKLEQIEDKQIEVQPIEETASPEDSKYAPLALYLLSRPSDVEGELMTFEDVEEMIRNKLPASARKYRAWWSNHLESNPQARQWWEVGWRVSYVDMENETVLFTRNHEREKTYDSFFTELYAVLSHSVTFSLRKYFPHGRNWMTISQLPGPTFLGFSFARQGRFRVELYIDTGEKEKNKHIYDTLFELKDEILHELEDLTRTFGWERLDDKRASRIALYHRGAISDTEEELASLRTWAVDAMIKFQRVMERHINEVL